MEDINEQIKVMQHFADGGKVRQVSRASGCELDKRLIPDWNWYAYSYHIIKEPIVIERWVNIYEKGKSPTYNTKLYADEGSGPSRLACVKLTGEYTPE